MNFTEVQVAISYRLISYGTRSCHGAMSANLKGLRVRLSSSVNVNIVNHVSLFAMGLITLAKKNYLKMTKSHLLRVKQISLPKALY